MSAFQNGNVEAALRFMASACAHPEAPAVWHRNHAEILDRSGDSEAAESAARLAVSRDPDYAAGWETLGTILAQRGQHAESCACYEKAVEIEPDFVQALNNLAVTLDRLGRHQAAERRYRQVLRLVPKSPEIQLNFATLLGEMGQHREAQAIVREVLDRYPNMIRAHSIVSEFKRKSAGRTSIKRNPKRQVQIERKKAR
jgi:tetratricopeptide (TPR) repeat protein